MKFSICIPTLAGRLKALDRALDSLDNQSYKNFEVIVIEKCNRTISHNHVNAVRHRGFWAFVKAQQSDSVAGAIREGLAIATGDIFVRTDDDCIFDAYWLENIKKAFDSDKMIAGVTGPTIVPEDLKGARDIFKYDKLIGKIFGLRPSENIGFHLDSGIHMTGSNYKWCLKRGMKHVSFLENCNWSMRTQLLKDKETNCMYDWSFPEKYNGLSEFCQEIPVYTIRYLHPEMRFMWYSDVIVHHLVQPSDSRRLHARNRLKNFWQFWHECIKPNCKGSVPYSKFMAYYFLQVCYYIAKKVKIL